MADTCRSAALRGQYGVVLAVGRQVEVRMQQQAGREAGEDEEDFNPNRKFNPNDLVFSGTVRGAAARATLYPPLAPQLYPPIVRTPFTSLLTARTSARTRMRTHIRSLPPRPPLPSPLLAAAAPILDEAVALNGCMRCQDAPETSAGASAS